MRYCIRELYYFKSNIASVQFIVGFFNFERVTLGVCIIGILFLLLWKRRR